MCATLLWKRSRLRLDVQSLVQTGEAPTRGSINAKGYWRSLRLIHASLAHYIATMQSARPSLLALFLLVLARPSAGRAELSLEPPSGAEVALAETLYREGRKLVAEQRYAEACAKFAESYRLDPATGTLLNLATCHEAVGKLASAWLEFSDAARRARREQREDRVRLAEEQLRALEPRLSRLTLHVNPTPGAPDLRVKLDGIVIGPAAYGISAPVNPGAHRIEASATGYEKWVLDVVVGPSADHQQVTVPTLEVARVTSSGLKGPGTLDGARTAPERPIPALVYGAGATTLALTGAALVSGLLYLDRSKEYEDKPSEDEALRTRALTLGYLNAGFTAAALFGAGVTAFLYATRPERPLGGASPRLAAWVLPGEGRVCVESEF